MSIEYVYMNTIVLCRSFDDFHKQSNPRIFEARVARIKCQRLERVPFRLSGFREIEKSEFVRQVGFEREN